MSRSSPKPAALNSEAEIVAFRFRVQVFWFGVSSCKAVAKPTAAAAGWQSTSGRFSCPASLINASI